MAHSPLPWYALDGRSIVDLDHCYVAELTEAFVNSAPLAEGNRDFILKAANNHYALITALSNALNSLEYLAPEKFDDAEHEAKWNAGLQSYRDAIANATA